MAMTPPRERPSEARPRATSDVPGDAAVSGHTIDELAHEFQVPVSTLRMYQHRGLLPPPVRRGRIGYYGGDHRARLRLVGELQERGFSLAGIKELLDGWESGRSLDDVLGLGDGAGVWEREEPLLMDPPELAKRFAGVPITPALMQRVIGLHLVELTDDGRLSVLSPRFLEIGSQLVDLGIPIDDILDQFETLRGQTDVIADQFTQLFRTHLWQSFAEAGLPAERVGEMTASLARLGPLAQAVVDAALRVSLQDAAQAFLDEQARRLANASPSSPRRVAAKKKAPAR